MTEISLRGRAAIITGAASGIGRALALEAVARGMSVGLADVDGAGLEKVAAELKGADPLWRQANVSSEADMKAFADACFDRFPSIAAVFANAGIIRYGSTVRPNLDEWRLVVDVNLNGPIVSVASFLSRLIERGEPAQFVVTGSQASFVVGPELAAYAAAKHGVWALVDILRLELQKEGDAVQVSMIAPGVVHTGLSTASIRRTKERAGEEASAAYIARMQQPADVARQVLDEVVQRRPNIIVGDDYRQMFNDRVRPLM